VRFSARIIRRGVVASAAIVAVAVLPALASAAAPTKETTVSGAFVVSAASCGFEVAVEPSQDKLRIFTFQDGHQLLTGSYVATATNLSNGKSIKVNLSGQGVGTADTFISTGGTLLIDPGALSYVHGPIIFTADGRRIVSSSVVDVCALLAGS
jgi:hypothetical protein